MNIIISADFDVESEREIADSPSDAASEGAAVISASHEFSISIGEELMTSAEYKAVINLIGIILAEQLKTLGFEVSRDDKLLGLGSITLTIKGPLTEKLNALNSIVYDYINELLNFGRAQEGTARTIAMDEALLEFTDRLVALKAESLHKEVEVLTQEEKRSIKPLFQAYAELQKISGRLPREGVDVEIEEDIRTQARHHNPFRPGEKFA